METTTNKWPSLKSKYEAIKAHIEKESKEWEYGEEEFHDNWCAYEGCRYGEDEWYIDIHIDLEGDWYDGNLYDVRDFRVRVIDATYDGEDLVHEYDRAELDDLEWYITELVEKLA